MDNRTEIERIEATNNRTSMPANPWEFGVDLGPKPDDMTRSENDVTVYDSPVGRNNKAYCAGCE